MNQTISKPREPKPTISQPSAASEASFWDESQIQAVIRHAGCTGRSPEEFFNKKWKRVLCRKSLEAGN